MRVRCTSTASQQRADDVWAGESLLYVLRERLGLPGSKNACEQGECGSCTVYLDGVPVCACLVAGRPGRGPRGRTVEGLADGGRGCTRCSRRSSTPAPSSAGSARPACRRGPRPARARTRARPTPRSARRWPGNLCRCTGYEKILDAVRLAAPRGRAR